MKKKFWAVPMALVAVLCTVLLTACGGPKVEDLIRDDLNEGLSAISADDDDFMEGLEQGADGSFEQLGIDPHEFAEAYLDGYAYEIGEITVDKDAGKATAEVTIHMKSLYAERRGGDLPQGRRGPDGCHQGRRDKGEQRHLYLHL